MLWWVRVYNMKYHKQEHLYIPGGPKRGSCYPTVYACLLDLELHDVPYFHLMYWTEEERDNFTRYCNDRYLDNKPIEEAPENQKTNWSSFISKALSLWDFVRETWLASQGYAETVIEDIDSWLKENKDVPYLAYGNSARGIGHVVIYQNGEMIHDPHPNNDGLISLRDGYPFTYLRKF